MSQYGAQVHFLIKLSIHVDPFTNWCNRTIANRSRAIQSRLLAEPKIFSHAHQFRSRRRHVMGQKVHDCMEKHLTCKYEGRICKEISNTLCYQASQGWISLWWGRKWQMQGRPCSQKLGYSLHTAEITLSPDSCCIGKHKNVSWTCSISGSVLKCATWKRWQIHRLAPKNGHKIADTSIQKFFCTCMLRSYHQLVSKGVY